MTTSQAKVSLDVTAVFERLDQASGRMMDQENGCLSAELLRRLKPAGRIGVIALTDYAILVELCLTMNDQRLSGDSLFQDPAFKQRLPEYFFVQNKWWVYFTVRESFIRGKIITHRSKLKKENVGKLETGQKQKEKALSENQSEALLAQMCDIKYEIYNKMVESDVFRLKTNFYECGDSEAKAKQSKLKQNMLYQVLK